MAEALAPMVGSMRALLVPLRAAMLGAAYGVKIRAPHSFVMFLLFDRKNGIVNIIKKAAASSFQHAKHLAYFAFVYKLSRIVLSRLLGNGGSAAVAGALGGYLVWRRNTALNYQILMYLTIRVAIATIRALAAHNVKPFALCTFSGVYPVLSVAVWAAVMYLYECHSQHLQPSLVASMHAIYRAAEPQSNSNSNSASASAVSAVCSLLPSPATVAVALQVITSAPSWAEAWRLLSLSST